MIKLIYEDAHVVKLFSHSNEKVDHVGTREKEMHSSPDVKQGHKSRYRECPKNDEESRAVTEFEREFERHVIIYEKHVKGCYHAQKYVNTINTEMQSSSLELEQVDTRYRDCWKGEEESRTLTEFERPPVVSHPNSARDRCGFPD